MNANELLRYLSDGTKHNYGWGSKPIIRPDHRDKKTRSYSWLYMPLIRLAVDMYNGSSVQYVRLPSNGVAVNDEQARLFRRYFNQTISNIANGLVDNSTLRNDLTKAENWDGVGHLTPKIQEKFEPYFTGADFFSFLIAYEEYVNSGSLPAALPAAAASGPRSVAHPSPSAPSCHRPICHPN